MSATADLLPPFDPTGYASITGAQLYQYLSGAAPVSDTGFTIVTSDSSGVPNVPDAATTTKWQRYLWIRITATSVNAYLWNPSATSDATYLKWVSVNIAGIGAGSITGSMIADNTITDAKIISLDYTKLTGVPATFSPGGAAGGDLTGTYPNPSVANAAITGAKIALTTITHANLGAQCVEVDTDIDPSAVGLSLIRTNAGATAMEHFVPQVITLLTNPASASDVGKVVRVASPYTNGYELADAAGTYQRVIKGLAGSTTARTTVIPQDTSIPQSTEGDEIITLTFTPKKTTSLVRVVFAGWASASGTGIGVTFALFNGAANALQAVGGAADNSGYAQMPTIDYTYAPGSVSPITFSIRLGPTSGSAYFASLSTALFGAAAKCFLVVEEFDGTLS